MPTTFKMSTLAFSKNMASNMMNNIYGTRRWGGLSALVWCKTSFWGNAPGWDGGRPLAFVNHTPIIQHPIMFDTCTNNHIETASDTLAGNSW